MYPKDWPRCVWCGDYALDGHLTCGRLACSESNARAQAAAAEEMERLVDELERKRDTLAEKYPMTEE